MRPSPLLALSISFAALTCLAGFRAVGETPTYSRSKAPKPALPATVEEKAGKRNAEEGLYDAAEGYLKRGPREEKTLVLTFDDGPHPSSANRLLDILKEADVKAAFFLVGERVSAHEDVVRRMIAEGHEVGNHTHDHARLHELSPDKIANELRRCGDAVRRATGRGMAFMRPPGMRFNPKVLAASRAQGYVMVGYNSAAGDYVPNGGVSDLTPEEASALGLDPKTIVDRIEKQLKPGTIILLHDNPITVEAIPELVARARAQGYRFVTTAEMMASLPEPVKIVANPEVGKK